jgi:pSer/pThr/pTyr-binding forkhead associated (FHA) protein
MRDDAYYPSIVILGSHYPGAHALVQMRYELVATKRWRIETAAMVGSAAESHIRVRLTPCSPSSKHAQLTVRGEQVWVEDLGSENGTFVNGNRVQAPTALKPGDRVSFHTEQYEIHATPVRWWDDDYAPEGHGTRLLTALTRRINPIRLKQVARPKARSLPVTVPQLVVQSGRRQGEGIPLRRNEVSDVGSDVNRHVRFEDQTVSTLHARIANDGAKWKLCDQWSRNGTFVNESRIGASNFHLSDGDFVRFGNVTCQFRLPNGSPDSKDVALAEVSPWLIGISSFVIAAGVIAVGFMLWTSWT